MLLLLLLWWMLSHLPFGASAASAAAGGVFAVCDLGAFCCSQPPVNVSWELTSSARLI
jgi:hypothetical protein